MTDIKMGPVFQVTALANIELLKSGQITRKYCHFFFLSFSLFLTICSTLYFKNQI